MNFESTVPIAHLEQSPKEPNKLFSAIGDLGYLLKIKDQEFIARARSEITNYCGITFDEATFMTNPFNTEYNTWKYLIADKGLLRSIRNGSESFDKERVKIIGKITGRNFSKRQSPEIIKLLNDNGNIFFYRPSLPEKEMQKKVNDAFDNLSLYLHKRNSWKLRRQLIIAGATTGVLGATGIADIILSNLQSTEEPTTSPVIPKPTSIPRLPTTTIGDPTPVHNFENDFENSVKFLQQITTEELSNKFDKSFGLTPEMRLNKMKTAEVDFRKQRLEAIIKVQSDKLIPIKNLLDWQANVGLIKKKYDSVEDARNDTKKLWSKTQQGIMDQMVYQAFLFRNENLGLTVNPPRNWQILNAALQISKDNLTERFYNEQDVFNPLTDSAGLFLFQLLEQAQILVDKYPAKFSSEPLSELNNGYVTRTEKYSVFNNRTVTRLPEEYLLPLATSSVGSGVVNAYFRINDSAYHRDYASDIMDFDYTPRAGVKPILFGPPIVNVSLPKISTTESAIVDFSGRVPSETNILERTKYQLKLPINQFSNTDTFVTFQALIKPDKTLGLVVEVEDRTYDPVTNGIAVSISYQDATDFIICADIWEPGKDPQFTISQWTASLEKTYQPEDSGLAGLSIKIKPQKIMIMGSHPDYFH